MIPQDDLAHTDQSRIDSRKLDQDIAAVPAFIDHAFNGFYMTADAGQTVHDHAGLRMAMVMSRRVRVGYTLGMQGGVACVRSRIPIQLACR